MERIAAAYSKAGSFENISTYLLPEDLAFYNSFSGDDQDRIQRIAATKSHNLGPTVPILAVTDVGFESKELVQIEKIVSLMFASRLSSTDLAFTDVEKQFYENLSQEDKDRVPPRPFPAASPDAAPGRPC